jgi:hypothetical protein
MVLVDTCGWIEWLTSGSLAGRYEPLLSQTQDLLVPTLVQFELYRWVCRERDEPTALEIIGVTEQGQGHSPGYLAGTPRRRPGYRPQTGDGRRNYLRYCPAVWRRTGNVRQPFPEVVRGKLPRQETGGKVIAAHAPRPA